MLASVLFVSRGIQQVRHALAFPSHLNPEDQRLAQAMGRLNSITHPIWLIGTIVLLLIGQSRWVLPLMVLVIGAHFVPMARILNRKIDYLLGPLAIVGAIIAGVIALEPQVPWQTVFAVAGIGGAVATLGYAFYMVRAYRRLCDRAGVPFPLPKIR